MLMVLNFFVPMLALAVTYGRIGWELWCSQAIGEVVPMQAERMRSKRKVHAVLTTDVRVGHKVGEIGPKWDKLGPFSDQIIVLKESWIFPCLGSI